MQSLPPLNITSNEHWKLQVYYVSSHGERKVKPGWFTNSSGAALEFQVNSSFAGHASARVQLVLHYTRSYDGWGRAELCCASGCECQCRQLDAHKEGTEKTSLIEGVTVAITQSAQCVMRLRTLPESSSGGHKFKLSSVMVRAEDDGPEGVETVARRQLGGRRRAAEGKRVQ